jgi:hypothetical protein
MNREELAVDPVRDLLEKFFAETDEPSVGEADKERVDWILEYVSSRFATMKYILGLALDFTLLAQGLASIDVEAKKGRLTLTEEQLFKRYTLVTKRGDRTANTLTLTFKGKDVGIRRIEEEIVRLFHALECAGYPSAYVYNTGQWAKYKDLLVTCFQLSESGRLYACHRLIAYGLENITRNTFYARSRARPRLYEVVLGGYPREIHPNENAGLVLQALAYGFVSADRPHLQIIADKVRTGSSRQRRFGDIDCYFGLGLEMSVEVKDMVITAESIGSQLAGFMSAVIDTHAMGIVLSADATTDAQALLREKGVEVLTVNDALEQVSKWDWQKQNIALHGALHYLAHIEQNADAVNRLLDFIAEHDPEHEALDSRES